MNAERDEVDDFLALAGRGFDGEAEVLAGDEQRVERIERAVQKRYAARPMPRPRRLVASVAGGVFAAGVAFAAWRGAVTGDGTKPAFSGAPGRLGAGSSSALPSVSTMAAVPVRSVTSSTPSAPLGSSVPRVRPSAPSTAQPTPPLDANVTAATLFAAANQARVAGDAGLAVALSQQLLARFPRSAEASSTHLSLGMLRLQQGQAELALAEFRAYEPQGGGDAMAEASWGEAQALRALGRSKEEMETLNELVRKFPRTPYAAAARKRLAGLP
jgi:TolA-binding protein